MNRSPTANPPRSQACVASAAAAVFALVAFIVALLSGLTSDLNAERTIVRAVVALAICWPLGWIAARLVIAQLPPVDAERDAPTAESAASRAGAGPEENPIDGQKLRRRAH